MGGSLDVEIAATVPGFPGGTEAESHHRTDTHCVTRSGERLWSFWPLSGTLGKEQALLGHGTAEHLAVASSLGRGIGG